MNQTVSEKKLPDRGMIGVRIREIRMERGYTCERLALQAGTTGGYIRQIESVRSPKLPSLDIFLHICEVLDVTPNYLLQDQLPSVHQDDQTDYQALWDGLSPTKQDLVKIVIKALSEQDN